MKIVTDKRDMPIMMTDTGGNAKPRREAKPIRLFLSADAELPEGYVWRDEVKLGPDNLVGQSETDAMELSDDKDPPFVNVEPLAHRLTPLREATKRFGSSLIGKLEIVSGEGRDRYVRTGELEKLLEGRKDRSRGAAAAITGEIEDHGHVKHNAKRQKPVQKAIKDAAAARRRNSDARRAAGEDRRSR